MNWSFSVRNPWSLWKHYCIVSTLKVDIFEGIWWSTGTGKQESSEGLHLSAEVSRGCSHPCSCSSGYWVSAEGSVFAQGYRLAHQAINQIKPFSYGAFNITVEAWGIELCWLCDWYFIEVRASCDFIMSREHTMMENHRERLKTEKKVAKGVRELGTAGWKYYSGNFLK